MISSEPANPEDPDSSQQRRELFKLASNSVGKLRINQPMDGCRFDFLIPGRSRERVAEQVAVLVESGVALQKVQFQFWPIAH